MPVRTRLDHSPATLLGGAGKQLTITPNHHHERAPLTVALMSGKRHFRLMCCVRHGRAAKIIGNCFYSESNYDKLTLFNQSDLQINFILDISVRGTFIIL